MISFLIRFAQRYINSFDHQRKKKRKQSYYFCLHLDKLLKNNLFVISKNTINETGRTIPLFEDFLDNCHVVSIWCVLKNRAHNITIEHSLSIQLYTGMHNYKSLKVYLWQLMFSLKRNVNWKECVKILTGI